MIKQAFAIAVVTLAGCSNGNGVSEIVTAQDPQSDAVAGACANEYYSELIGTYDGQIDYNDGELSCSWDVDMQITGEPNFNLCALSFNVVSSGGDDVCLDVGTGGSFSESLAGRPDLWDSVVWPVDGFGQMNSSLPEGIYPIETASVLVRVTFDGAGNLTYPDSRESEPKYTGVLVKQFDLADSAEQVTNR